MRAGLELVKAVSDLNTHAALQTRVGIATGLVVVGELVGSGEAQERGIVGETPNLAARSCCGRTGKRSISARSVERYHVGGEFNCDGSTNSAQTWCSKSISLPEYDLMFGPGVVILALVFDLAGRARHAIIASCNVRQGTDLPSWCRVAGSPASTKRSRIRLTAL